MLTSRRMALPGPSPSRKMPSSRCSVPTNSSPSFCASCTARSTAALARGVMYSISSGPDGPLLPTGWFCAIWLARVITVPLSMPSTLRTCSTTPPGRLSTPINRCSVPSTLPGPRRTTPCAVSMASRARSENLFTSMEYLALVLGLSRQAGVGGRDPRGSGPPAPAAQRHDLRVAHRHHLEAMGALDALNLAVHRGGGLLEPRLQALDLGGHGVHLLFHGQHALHAGQVEPQLSELLDALQPLHVALRVAARVLGRALRAHQAAPLVQAQRLRVHVGQLGRHRDHEERPVVVLLSHRSASPPQPSTVARGSGRVAPSFSNSCFCSLVSLSGTCTCSRTWRSPWPPLSLGAPLPRTRNVRLSWLPAGTLRATRPPPGGILTLVPSAASEIVTGTSRTTSSPRRSNSSSGSTLTLTKRSPDGPPRRPASPLPLMRILLPSLTPAGILTA